MAKERKTVRFYTDLSNGFNPDSIGFVNGSLVSSAPASGFKRVWIELELPSDSDLFPEVHSGVELGRLRFGDRRIEVEQSVTYPSPGDRPDPRAEPEVRRRIGEVPSERRRD